MSIETQDQTTEGSNEMPDVDTLQKILDLSPDLERNIRVGKVIFHFRTEPSISGGEEYGNRPSQLMVSTGHDGVELGGTPLRTEEEPAGSTTQELESFMAKRMDDWKNWEETQNQN